MEVPASDQIAYCIEHAPPDDDPRVSFVDRYHGKKTAYAGLAQAWYQLKKKTGLDLHLNFHDLRRTIAVSMYEISKDLRIAEQMLGHESLGSTVRSLSTTTHPNSSPTWTRSPRPTKDRCSDEDHLRVVPQHTRLQMPVLWATARRTSIHGFRWFKCEEALTTIYFDPDNMKKTHTICDKCAIKQHINTTLAHKLHVLETEDLEALTHALQSLQPTTPQQTRKKRTQ